MTPTVGRHMLYHPKPDDPGGNVPGGPFAAIISRVNSADNVNLMVISGDGMSFGRTNIPILQTEAHRGRMTGPYCEWPQFT